MRKQERQTSDSHVKLMLTEVYYTDADNRRCPVKISGKEMAEVKGNITLRLSCPNYNNEPLRYRFRLKGNGVNLRSDSLRPEITFNNLKYGKYHFTAEVANELGSQPRTVSFDFFHPRPFYLSVPAFILYVLFMILIIHLLIRRNTNIKLEKIRQQVEKEKIEQELKMADQQRVIEKQQKKILEQQLQEKSREIATLTMDAVNMDNDGYWKIYRENFDLIHKKFFRTLRERYPSLTATDLKFCALLRLNLATKDIANFMGLTIRGVEGARYRIRKKLHLPEETSLPEFLIDLK